MKPNAFIGLVKFFRNESYLDMLISGTFHCQTPEIYRLHEQEGISDKFESCRFSYRKERDDPLISLTLNGVEINDALAITIHNGDGGESWLNCWLVLRVPANEEELESLNTDIDLMKKQFGEHYAYISPPDLEKVIEILKKNSEKPLTANQVLYHEDEDEWGIFCKSPTYAYQREYRFAFGECSPSETEAYCFQCPEGFQDLIYKNPQFELKSHGRDEPWFHL